MQPAQSAAPVRTNTTHPRGVDSSCPRALELSGNRWTVAPPISRLSGTYRENPKVCIGHDLHVVTRYARNKYIT